MKSKVSLYKNENDTHVESISTQEMLRMNPQESHVTIGDGCGCITAEYDQLAIIFSAVDPCPSEDREPFAFDPNEPLAICIDRKDTLDHLIATLQTLRHEIWGYDFDINKN